jgi:hypothetical protein
MARCQRKATHAGFEKQSVRGSSETGGNRLTMKMTLRYAHLAPKVRRAAVALLVESSVENQMNASI